jgi:thioredoxin 1
MMAPLLEESETKNPGKIAKVDVDASSAIAAKYSIKNIPTTLVFEKGILIDKKIGVLKESDITTMLN